MESRESISKKAAVNGIILNVILAVFKLLIGIISGSMAILADGIDTSTDIFTSFLTLIAAKISNKPADESHPYGHEKIEPVITKILSIIIIYAGFEVLLSSVKKLINKEYDISNPGLILAISLFSLFIKFFLYRYKLSVGKKINSSSFIADAKNMRNDILTSFSIFVGIIIYYFTGAEFIDSVLAIFVSFFILKTGISLLLETSDELMDGSKELGEIYKECVEVAEKTSPDVKNPHKIRVRKAGFVYFIEMHVEVPENMTVKKANEISEQIEKNLKLKNIYIKDILIHFEPIGNKEIEEFGFDKNSIKEHFGGETDES